MKEALLERFKDVFGAKDNAQVFFAPGRVNLIGEHTDYNGGNVFPCALTFGTYGVVRTIDDKVFKLYSMNFSNLGVIEFPIEELKYNREHNWANYPKGIIYNYIHRGFNIDRGLEILYYGDIPNGAGLSSSASIEVLTAIIIKDLFGIDIDMMEIVKLCKETENSFIGVNCGIMDQFAIGMGKKNNAMLLDTNTLKYEYVKFELDTASIVIANTNKVRGLADSKYNERRSQCEAALKDLQRKLKINSLGELTEEEFEESKYLIEATVNMIRARHAVYENRRTIKAVEALRENNIKYFGELMNGSHISLRDDYEVTGFELDTLVELAWKQPGVIGSRMTGAGFGGCTVSIVKNEFIESFITEVGKAYKDVVGYAASFYIATIGDGPVKL